MEYNILSFNIRLDVSSDQNNSFKNRQNTIIDFFNSNRFDLIGFQEVTPEIYAFLQNNLSDFDSFIEYRGDNMEAVPIFYNRDLFTLIEQDTFWLSDNPSVPSKFDKSAHNRICTYGIFKTQKEKLLCYLNIHLDYKHDDICLKQIKVVLNKLALIRKKFPNIAVVAGGDFNQKPDSKTILYTRKHLKVMLKPGYLTFHGFNPIKFGEPIDYFFYDNIKHASFDIIHYKGTNYLSDHYPIKLKIKL